MGSYYLIGAHSHPFGYWILEKQDHLLMSRAQPENCDKAVIDSGLGRSSKLGYYRDDCMIAPPAPTPPMAERKHYKSSGKR